MLLFWCCFFYVMTTAKVVFTCGCYVLVGVIMFLLFCCLCGDVLSLFLWFLLKVSDVDVVVTSFFHVFSWLL